MVVKDGTLHVNTYGIRYAIYVLYSIQISTIVYTTRDGEASSSRLAKRVEHNRRGICLALPAQYTSPQNIQPFTSSKQPQTWASHSRTVDRSRNAVAAVIIVDGCSVATSVVVVVLVVVLQADESVFARASRSRLLPARREPRHMSRLQNNAYSAAILIVEVESR